MFPGIDGFHWTAGHIIFLGLFFAVVVTLLMTIASALWRTSRDFRNHANRFLLEVGLRGVARSRAPLPSRTVRTRNVENL